MVIFVDVPNIEKVKVCTKDLPLKMCCIIVMVTVTGWGAKPT